MVAATSRPDLIDAALLRPGRLDRLIYCGFPSPRERGAVLAALAREVPLGPDVDLAQVLWGRPPGWVDEESAALSRRSVARASPQALFNVPTDSIYSRAWATLPSTPPVLLCSPRDALPNPSRCSSSPSSRLFRLLLQLLTHYCVPCSPAAWL